MIKFDLLLKRMWTVLAVLFCTVVSAQAAAITYQLKTHVDGRTITATANLNAGDNLNDKMPQTLWRAYTTYKYYSDADLTQEITEAPASGGTVYVDYEFDPPFILSEEGQDPVWHYLRTYNSGGSNNYLVIYDQSAENEWGTYKQTILSWKSVNGATPKAGSNYPIAKAGHDQWAFYGDGYAFQVRLNDSSIANNYLIWRHTSRDETPMGLGAKPEVGWQLYVNTASNSKLSGGTMAMGPYNTTNYLASLENVNSSLWTDNLTTSKQYFDEHNQLVYKPGSASQTTTNKNNLWWYAFFATPVTDPANSTDIWHVTYKIQDADGNWYDDIVLQKRANNLTPTWPVQGFTPKEGYEYDYFYTDATFTEKLEGAMPNDCNTTLYIKETAPVVPVIYYVTYKIQKADGTWYDDIIEEKNDNNLTPTWPVTGFTPVEGYEYDYFYTDATFAEKLEGAMPADCNSTLFIKETEPEPINYISQPWKTLVLPFGIDEGDLPAYFGEDFEGVPAVDVLELQGIENGVLTSNAAGDFYRCNLIFNPVTAIKANKPYMFRVNRVDEKIITKMYAAEGQDPCDVTTVDDLDNPGISVSMEGTLNDNGYNMDASDGLHFYFGYDQNANAYNFYRVSNIIPKNRCWFYVEDKRNNPSGAKLNVSFDFNIITGIDKTVVSSKAADGKIYNINGQQVQNTLQKGIYIVNGKKVIVK
ncbi:MAG: hypothetical protein IKH63_01510 [Prevotella sp.]|nr:hypothetical protein [Prevotella sp.]